MKVFEVKKYIYVLTPKEKEEKGTKHILNDLSIKRNISENFNIENHHIDKDGNSVYLVHVWVRL